MGITRLSLNRIENYITKKGKMLILGCQNLYDSEHYGEIAHGYFEKQGFVVSSWDICGCNGSEIKDLREPISSKIKFESILNHGTTEHIDGSLYEGFKNIHNLCKKDGLMIHENPKTGNWPKHGYHYMTQEFYVKLAELAGYELLEVTEEAAMGNDVDGWNVCAVLKKTTSDKFITEEEFNTLDYRTS